MLISAIVDRFEDSQAIIILENADQIIWPKQKLPPETKEGQHLNINISLDHASQDKQENIAKKFLNEILEN